MSDKTISFSLFGNRFYFTPKFTLWMGILIIWLLGLGYWQLNQAKSATTILNLINNHVAVSPVQISDLENGNDLAFYPIQVQGHFDNEHQILLTDRQYLGQNGYMVITPFKIDNSSTRILVNRGWVPLGKNPENLPALSPVAQKIMITGLLLKPPFLSRFTTDFDEHNVAWPLLINHANLNKISEALGYPLQPYMILLNPANDDGFIRNWKSYTASLNPERNQANAFQWFSLAALMFVIFIFTNLERG